MSQARSDAAPSAGEAVIRTPDQRLRVFVSSTLNELREERTAAREAISGLRLTPVLFEQGARPYPPRALYRAYLDQSHVFVGIYWQQYGWVAPDMDVSGIEDEYRIAADRPRLIYIREPAPERDPRLAGLLDRIRREGRASYKSFGSPAELQTLIQEDLAVLLSERFEGAERAPAPDGPRPAGVPVPASRFIGREREVQAVRGLLEQQDVRLVTLTEPGGIGKTRLALEVAGGVQERFRDGVGVVTLDSVPDPAMVVPAIRQALGLRDPPGREPLDALRDYLRDRQMLLVLDGFERVIGAAPVVADLLETCGHLKVLVTSREVLRISGEHAFDVPPLSVPESTQAPAEAVSRSEAVRLFVDRAQAVNERFRLDDTNAPAVAEIARRLEGLPLAIELAAARVRMLPPAAILGRLDRRLGLLTGGPRDLPERQRTLRSTIDWSYDLLEDRDRTLLARLGVFAGGWTLDAVETVGADDGKIDAIEALSSLVDKSLVRQDGFAGDEPRFSMFETVREYALERLEERGETERRRDLHANYVLALAERAAPERITTPREHWIERMNAESGNVRAAMQWLLDRRAAGRAARMGWALWNGWWLRYHLPEAVSWMGEALAATDALSAEERAKATFVLGVAAFGLGDREHAIPHLRESHALFQQTGDRDAMAGALGSLGSAVAEGGREVEGETMLRQALATYRDLGNSWGIAQVNFGLARVLVTRGRSDEAIPLLEQDVAWARQAGERMTGMISLVNLGHARLGVGDLSGAKAALLESLRLADDLGNWEGTGWALNVLAALAAAAGDAKRGTLLLGAAERTRRSRTWVWHEQTRERTERALRAALGEDQFALTFAEGTKLSTADALKLAGEI